jgi:hypothetical protein
MSRDFMATTKVDALLTDRTKNLADAVDEQLGDMFLGMLAWLQDATGGDERKALALLKSVDDAGGIEAVLSGRQSAQPALGAGTTTTGSSGGPATIDKQQALQVILNDPDLSDGSKNAILRILNPGGTGGIFVDANGTPNEISELRQNLSDARELTKAALEGAGLTPDPNESPAELKIRMAGKISGPDTTKVKDELAKARSALNSGHAARLGGENTVLKDDELDKAKTALDGIEREL